VAGSGQEYERAIPKDVQRLGEGGQGRVGRWFEADLVPLQPRDLNVLAMGWRRKTSTEESPKGAEIPDPVTGSSLRLISRLEGRMIREAKDGIQAIRQSSRR
jgi:hypothetical protein